MTVLTRSLRLKRNALIRRSDRLEAGLLIGAVLLALVAIPFAAAAGSEAYAGKVRRATEETAARQEVTAVLVADAPPVRVRLDGVPLAEKVEAVARWTVPGGPVREGVVTVEAGSPGGGEVRIWLDAKGHAVEAPATVDDAKTFGVGVGTGLWLGWIALLATVFLVCRSALGRARAAAWEREWRRVSQDWTVA